MTGRCGRIGGQKENGADGRVGAANKETAVQNKMKTVSQDGGCPDMRAWAAAPGKEKGMPMVRMLQISPICDRALTARRQGSVTWSPRLCDKSTVTRQKPGRRQAEKETPVGIASGNDARRWERRRRHFFTLQTNEDSSDNEQWATGTLLLIISATCQKQVCIKRLQCRRLILRLHN